MPPNPPGRPPLDPDAISAAAQGLWGALRTARATGMLTDQATLEDALFRLHLPMAAALVQQHPAAGTDPAAALRAAELGLSHAILGWQRGEGTGFDRYARAMISRQLGNNPPGRRRTPPGTGRSSADQ